MNTFKYTTTSKTILADLYTPVGVYMRLQRWLLGSHVIDGHVALPVLRSDYEPVPVPRRRCSRSLPGASACTVAAKRGKRGVGYAKAESRHLLVVVRAAVEVAFVVLVAAEPNVCATAGILPRSRSADVRLGS